jgi:hypothetical protein
MYLIANQPRATPHAQSACEVVPATYTAGGNCETNNQRVAPSGLGVILIADQPRALPWAFSFGPVGAIFGVAGSESKKSRIRSLSIKRHLVLGFEHQRCARR